MLSPTQCRRKQPTDLEGKMSLAQDQPQTQSVINGHVAGVPEIPSYSIRSLKDRTTQSLAKCLQKNHTTFAALRDPQLLFHNHMPHVRVSATLCIPDLLIF